MNLTDKDPAALPVENSSRSDTPEGKILSMHPVISGDEFYWDRGVWDENLSGKIKEAGAVILPQTVERELYCFCKKMCPLVFPNYDLRLKSVIHLLFGHSI